MIDNLAGRVKETLGQTCHSVLKLPVITCAASLAHHGLLGSVRLMRLDDVDLTSVPAEHLASLASSVTESVTIINVSGCGLVTILDNVKSRDLVIRYQRLDSEETQALVWAMESGVEIVRLYGKVTLEIRDLMEYSGQGKCRRVWFYSDAVDRYREQLRIWAMNRNWRVIHDGKYDFSIKRI